MPGTGPSIVAETKNTPAAAGARPGRSVLPVPARGGYEPPFDPASPPAVVPIGDDRFTAGPLFISRRPCQHTGLPAWGVEFFPGVGEGLPRYHPHEWPSCPAVHPHRPVGRLASTSRGSCWGIEEMGLEAGDVGPSVWIDLRAVNLFQAARTDWQAAAGDLVRRLLAGDLGDDGQASALALPDDASLPLWPVLPRPVRSALVLAGRIEGIAVGVYPMHRPKPTRDELRDAGAATGIPADPRWNWSPLAVALVRCPSAPHASPSGAVCHIAPLEAFREHGVA
jgi:hypothetical protein